MNLNNIKNFTAKTFRFGAVLPVSNLLLAYGNGRLPDSVLRSIAQYRHRVAEQKIARISPPRNVQIAPSNNDTTFAGNIWVLWLQGEEKMPALVKMCLQSIRKNSNGHPVILLDSNNLQNYITLPERIWRLYADGKISHAHFSDIVRMKLLATHGGFWIDATIYLARPIPDAVFESDYFTLKDTPRGTFVSDYRWAGFFQWCRPGCALPAIVSDMFERYWASQNLLLDYFFIDYAIDMIYKFNIDVKQSIDAVPLNNPNVYSLVDKLTEPYDYLFYQNCISNTFAFKLNWKQYADTELLQNKNSFFAHMSRFSNML